MTPGERAYATFVRPFVLGFREPIVFVWNMYIALLYGTLYVFIASFPIVFVGNHGFNLGENGLAFMVSTPHSEILTVLTYRDRDYSLARSSDSLSGCHMQCSSSDLPCWQI